MVVTHRHVLLALLRAEFSRERSSGRLLTQSRLVVQRHRCQSKGTRLARSAQSPTQDT